MLGQSEYRSYDDLRHPNNVEVKKQVFEIFVLPLDISFDSFNEKYDGMIRMQYIKFIEQLNSFTNRKATSLQYDSTLRLCSKVVTPSHIFR